MKPFVRRSAELATGAELSLFFASQAFAVVAIPVNNNFANANTIIKTIFSVVTVVGIILFVVLLLIGGIQYLGSFGNEESTKTARKLILDAVVGLFIVLAAGGVAQFVLQQFGVDNAVQSTDNTVSN